jgi:hypothetical protein
VPRGPQLAAEHDLIVQGSPDLIHGLRLNDDGGPSLGPLIGLWMTA